jgi:KUP system potassium uptake protein
MRPAATSSTARDMSQETPKESSTAMLALMALGIVFGDIGTSPLYALRECFVGPTGLTITTGNVLGVVSVMLWTLVLIVCVKYIVFVMRADNRGEGGILALVALVTSLKGAFQKKHYGLFVTLGILGVALLYSDGVITPAISVLGAVEGLAEATPLFQPYIIPISLIILIGLFLIQSKGTAKVSAFFGPIIIVWFIAIAVLGLRSIFQNPRILASLNPYYAISFLLEDWKHSFGVLGSVFLAVTGAEVMYADMGHFGARPIRLSWFYVVFPSLLLNYMGQGAFLLTLPKSVENLFYLIVPAKLLYPMVILASLAAIIASQAVISGAFSLARQSVQLGFLPRLIIRHTSKSAIGQVYVPFVNWSIMVGVIILVLMFRQSSNLGAAYGIAVATTMLITGMLILFVARGKWHAPWPLIALLGAVFLTIDGTFFASNILKIKAGGWIVLLMAFAIYLIMKTWLDGRSILKGKVVAESIDLQDFVGSVAQDPPQRVSGTAVFLAGNPHGVPGALLHNLKHNKIMHEHTVVLSVKTEEVPYVSAENRTVIDYLGAGIYRIMAAYGFSETADIPALLAEIQFTELRFDPMQTTFFLGREALVVSENRLMLTWRKKIFLFLSHNSLNATSFFRLPPNRVVELGSQIGL